MKRSSNSIDESAADWVVRHDTGTLTPEEREQFESWLAADVRHQGAFVRLSAVRADLGRIVSLASGRREEFQGRARARFSPQISRRWAIAAGLATLLTGIAAWFLSAPDVQRYASAVGEIHSVTLVDGSRMTLSSATQARVHFSEAKREIWLADGEALFEVAKDRARPLIVHAADMTVTAIGTAFVVRVADSLVDVAVTEGVVELAQPDAATRSPRRVAALQRAVAFDPQRIEIETIAPEDIERRLAWRDGMVAFNGESLEEAVAQINRYNRRSIVIADPALARQPIIGMFRATDIETFAHTAAAVVNAKVIDEGAVIRLESDPMD